MEVRTSGARPSSAPASVRRRQEIIDAARTLLRERNADEFVVADVARVAGVSVATVYNLVGTRDRLLLAVLEQAVSDVDLAIASSDSSPTASPSVSTPACCGTTCRSTQSSAASSSASGGRS